MTQGTCAASPPVRANIDRLVMAIVRRNGGMLAAFPDLTEDDLYQEAMAAILKALPDYDPAKASLQTFASTVAGRRLIDVWRRRGRQAKREANYAEENWGISTDCTSEASGPNNGAMPVDDHTPLDDVTADEPEPTQTLAEWLRSVYLKAKRQYGAGRFRQGRRFHNVAQVVACAVLMRKRGLSSRGAIAMFRNHHDLAEAVRFRHVPNHMWFWRCPEVATDFLSRRKQGK